MFVTIIVPMILLSFLLLILLCIGGEYNARPQSPGNRIYGK